MSGKIITLFGSAKPREDSPAFEDAYRVGKALAESDYTVCNGGYGGTMLASAKGAKNAGGKTIGVTVKVFSSRANKHIDQEIRTSSHFERLDKLISLGDAFVVFPGGTGTLVELSTCWELINKRFIAPRPIIIYTDFWQDVISTVNKDLLTRSELTLTENRQFSNYKFLFQANSAEQVVEIVERWFHLDDDREV